MRDFLETIAQQIDKVAENPLDVAIFFGGALAFVQYFGWWGLAAWIALLIVLFGAVDLIVYLVTHGTRVKYRDTDLWMSGFHPFRARAAARSFDRYVKKHGETAVINELHRIALERGCEVTVTHTSGSVSTLPLEEAEADRA